MTHDELLLFATKTFDDCLTLLDNKGHDYSRPDDCFSALRTAEQFGLCSLETTIASQLCQRFGRLMNLIAAHKEARNESVDDGILDLINYLVLLKGAIKEENK